VNKKDIQKLSHSSYNNQYPWDYPNYMLRTITELHTAIAQSHHTLKSSVDLILEKYLSHPGRLTEMLPKRDEFIYLSKIICHHKLT